MKTLHIECPDPLAEQLEQLVREGWVVTQEQAILEALQRFIDAHQPELMKSQILDDVEWGLRGRD